MSGVSLLQVFFAFLRLGAMAYGGPAMVAYVRQECVGRREWLSDEEFKDGMALCRVTPGATIIHMATRVGNRLRGPSGAAAAAMASVLPAFLFMTILSTACSSFGGVPTVRTLFTGLAAIVVAIMLNACIFVSQIALYGW